MSIVKRTSEVIPIEIVRSMDSLDEMFFKQIQMNGERVLCKFQEQFDDTKRRIFDGIEVTYLIESYSLNDIKGDTVRIDKGTKFNSPMLSKVLKTSHEVLLGVVTLHGYDEIEEKAVDGLDVLFIDGWGTAIAECSHSFIAEELKNRLESESIYSTHSWSPGQHNVDIKLQKELFDVLHPEDVNISLSKTFMMTPKKSISFIIGLGDNPDAEDIRSCDFCEHRETCPSAYK